VRMKRRDDDFQRSEMPRSNNISDARHPKRRRLSDNSFEEILRNPHAVSNPLFEHHEYEYTDLVVVGEEGTQVQCQPLYESDVVVSSANVTDDGWPECCYGMVGSYMTPYNMAVLITFFSCLTSVCDFDILHTCNCPRTFPLPFEPPTHFPR
jgi:hypothetical protein